MTLVSLAVVALFRQELPDRPVTLELRGTRLEKAFPVLENHCGTKLRVDPALKDCVIAVRVKDRSAKSLLTLISNALAADWSLRRGVWLLERKPETVSLLKTQEREAQLSAVKDRQRVLAEKAGKAYWTPVDNQQFLDAVNKVRKRTPTGQRSYNDGPQFKHPSTALASWLFSHIDLTRAVGSKDFQAVRFTTAPAPGTSRFDNACRAQIDSFFRQQADFSQRIRSNLPSGDQDWQFYKDILALGDRSKGPFELVFTVRPLLTGITGGFTVYDSLGKSVTSAFVSDVLPLVPDPPESEIVKRQANRTVELSPEALWASGLVGNPLGRMDRTVGQTIAEKGFSNEDKAKWAMAEEADPLSYATTDVAFSLDPDRDVVALLIDQMIAFTQSSLSNGKLSQATFWSQHKTRPSLTVEECEGAIVIRPALRLFSERLRVDRNALGPMLRQLNKDGIVTVRNWSKYFSHPGARDKYRWAQYMMMSPYQSTGFETPHRLDAYEDTSSAFIGTLGSAALDQLERTGRFQTSRFDSYQAKLLNDLGGVAWEDGFKNSRKWDTLNSPDQVLIELSPCDVAQSSMKTPTGWYDVYYDPANTPADRLQQIQHPSTKKFMRKCRRFRISVSWRDAPSFTFDLIEFGRPESE